MPSLTAVEPAAEPILGKPLPLRVGFAGARGRALLGAGVHAVELGPERVDELDAVVVELDGPASPHGTELARAARARGKCVIAVGAPGEETAVADLHLGSGYVPEPPVLGAPPVNVHSFNPGPFRRDGVGGYHAIGGPDATEDGVAAALPLLRAAAEFEPVALSLPRGVARPDLPPEIVAVGPLGADPAEWLEALHGRLGVLDHPGFHASDWERAGLIAKLCASGVPVVCAEMSQELRALLGSELADLLEPVSERDLADLEQRERISVALRRVALREHSLDARWRQIANAAGISLPDRPMVSVIFATRREGWLEHGLAQVNRQTYEPRELVVCLHGDEFGEGIKERVRSLGTGDVRIVHVDSGLTLGDALNAGVEVARGELVSKMDDDDYYNTDHLWDLALALDYSGADLAGKAAEFVYLEEIDVTVRQISHDVETRLAGGGMMMRRAPLVEEGGWPQRTRAEDLALIRRYEGDDRPIHRIPPHGYILNRHGRDHTWRPAVDYFLFRSEQQWRGLRFDATGID
jgi:hypothetical protein